MTFSFLLHAPCEHNAGECEVLQLLQQQLVLVRKGVVGDAAPYLLSCRVGAGGKCVGHDGESTVKSLAG